MANGSGSNAPGRYGVAHKFRPVDREALAPVLQHLDFRSAHCVVLGAGTHDDTAWIESGPPRLCRIDLLELPGALDSPISAHALPNSSQIRSLSVAPIGSIERKTSGTKRSRWPWLVRATNGQRTEPYLRSKLRAR